MWPNTVRCGDAGDKGFMSFTGFYSETFSFLFEIAFNNNVEWFNANKDRYERFVKAPMRLLASELMQDALKIDPNFNPSITTSVSRIRRDTRFTYDKSPFRNHMWIGFRYPKTRISESSTIYFEIAPEGYSYGFGLYSASSEFMNTYRKRLLSDPQGLSVNLSGRGIRSMWKCISAIVFQMPPSSSSPILTSNTLAGVSIFQV